MHNSRDFISFLVLWWACLCQLQLFKKDVEDRASATTLPMFWKRYIDDVCAIVSRNQVSWLLQHLKLCQETSSEEAFSKYSDEKPIYYLAIFRGHMLALKYARVLVWTITHTLLCISNFSTQRTPFHLCRNLTAYHALYVMYTMDRQVSPLK